MPELTLEVREPEDSSAPLGWLVIDSMICGRSHGGLRISRTTGPEELSRLACRMTLKFGFLGIANGGAKAGIVGDPEADPQVRRLQLEKFARALFSHLRKGQFFPHPDMGTTASEIRQAFELPRQRRLTDREASGWYTGIGVAAAAKIAVRHLRREWSGISVAVEGFGKVGSAVAAILQELGAKIIAVSTSGGALYRRDGLNIPDLLFQAKQGGSGFVRHYPEADRITPGQLLELPVDILSPCADSGSIHAGNAGRIQARLICPGANCPVTPEAETILSARGIGCLPDFLTSSGGVLGGTMSYAGVAASRIKPLMFNLLESRFDRFLAMTSDQAEQECRRRFQRMKQAFEQEGWRQKFFQTGLSLHRQGWIPGFVTSRLAPRYFLSR